MPCNESKIMSKKHEDIQELFICQCHDVQHQFIIRTVDFDETPEVFLSIFLYPASFFKRIVYAVKYIFGHRSVFGHFDEIIIKPEDAPRLQKVVDMLEEARIKESTRSIEGSAE